VALTRRSFLGTLGASIAGLVAGAELDLDKLLWVPGQKTFFIPDQTIIEAKTIAEALGLSLHARCSDGTVQEAQLSQRPGESEAQLTERMNAWIRSAELLGAKVTRGPLWVRHSLGHNTHADTAVRPPLDPEVGAHFVTGVADRRNAFARATPLTPRKEPFASWCQKHG